MSSLLLTGFMGELSWGLPVPKPRVGVVGTDMECGPMGELMTEKGGPMPLMGELRVLMGECSCPGEPSEEPMLGPREGCSEGAAMELRAVGELREEEFTCVEKSGSGLSEEEETPGVHTAEWRLQDARLWSGRWGIPSHLAWLGCLPSTRGVVFTIRTQTASAEAWF